MYSNDTAVSGRSLQLGLRSSIFSLALAVIWKTNWASITLIEDDLQIEEEALDPPTQKVERDNFLGRQSLRAEAFGERLVGFGICLQPDETK